MEDLSKEYMNAILQQYEIVKNGADFHLLDNPSPANLKRLCLEALDRDFHPKDKEVFDRFSDKKEKTLHGFISNMNAEDLKTPSNFLKSGKLLKKIEHADILAILIDFEPRPYANFRKLSLGEKAFSIKNQEEDNSATTSFQEKSIEPITENYKGKENATEHTEKNTEITASGFLNPVKKPINKAFIALTLLLLCGLFGFAYYKSTAQKCMIWKDDHFERIDCEPSTITNFMSTAKIHPFNEELFENQRKVTPNDTTTFFKNGEPVLYYLKKDNKCEFFTLPGWHPVHRKALRPVSERIVRKYSGLENFAVEE